MFIEYIQDIITHDVGVDKRKPTFLNFSVTNKCNARCEMCDIWKYPSVDHDAALLEKAFSNNYLSDIRAFGITGGEPFLRKDLPEIIQLAAKKFQNTSHIGITSNGFNTFRIDRLLAETKTLVDLSSINLNICISIDGLDEVHNKSRGIKGVWNKVEKTVDLLHSKYKRDINLSFACTITNTNASFAHLAALDDYARGRSIPILYRIAVKVDRIFNDNLIDLNGVRPKSKEAEEVVKFLDDRLLTQFKPRIIYYHMIKDYLQGDVSSRSIKCKEMRDGIMLDSNADVYICSVSGELIGNLLNNSENELIQKSYASRKCVRDTRCDKCFHDHISHKSPQKLITSFVREMV